VEAAGFSERLANPYQTTWHHIPKNSSLYNSSCSKDVRDTKLERQQSSASGTVYKFNQIQDPNRIRQNV